MKARRRPDLHFLLVLFYQGCQTIEAFVSASLLSISGPMLFASEQSGLFSEACLVYYVKTPACTVPWLNCFASANSLLLANGFSHLFDLFMIGLVSACAYHGALESRSELREAKREMRTYAARSSVGDSDAAKAAGLQSDCGADAGAGDWRYGGRLQFDSRCVADAATV